MTVDVELEGNSTYGSTLLSRWQRGPVTAT